MPQFNSNYIHKYTKLYTWSYKLLHYKLPKNILAFAGRENQKLN